MDALDFLGLQPTHNPNRWVLPVTPGICTAGDFLFGGCGLGAAIGAMEATSGRRLVWATAQYLSYAKPGEIMDIDVTLATVGHQITQARAVAHVADREVLTVNGALGERSLDVSGQWVNMPDVPPPSEAPPRNYSSDRTDSLMYRIDMRLAMGRDFRDYDGTMGPGECALWARMPDLDMSPAALAVLGDYVPFGIGQTLGQLAGGNSLDNTLRMGELVPTEWVLLYVRIHMIQRGFGHGHVHLFAEDGTLLATASQSTIVRFWPEARRETFAKMTGVEPKEAAE